MIDTVRVEDFTGNFHTPFGILALNIAYMLHEQVVAIQEDPLSEAMSRGFLSKFWVQHCFVKRQSPKPLSGFSTVTTTTTINRA